MESITFQVEGDTTLFSCGCSTTTIGGNFIIAPCSLNCPVYKYSIEQGRNQGNMVQYQIGKDHR